MGLGFRDRLSVEKLYGIYAIEYSTILRCAALYYTIPYYTLTVFLCILVHWIRASLGFGMRAFGFRASVWVLVRRD